MGRIDQDAALAHQLNTGQARTFYFNGQPRTMSVGTRNGRAFANSADDRARLEQMQRDRAGFRRTYNVFRGIGLGVPAAAAVLPAAAAGMAATGGASLPAAATAGIAPMSSAPLAASAISGVLRHPLVNLGANGVFGLLQQRSQNRAADRALSAQTALTDRQLALEQQRLADERADMLAAREEDRRRWEADEAYRKAVLDRDNAYLEEDRGYQREREAVRASFRPYQQMAMARLGRYLR